MRLNWRKWGRRGNKLEVLCDWDVIFGGFTCWKRRKWTKLSILASFWIKMGVLVQFGGKMGHFGPFVDDLVSGPCILNREWAIFKERRRILLDFGVGREYNLDERRARHALV